METIGAEKDEEERRGKGGGALSRTLTAGAQVTLGWEGNTKVDVMDRCD
jgi:hypothetical protein